MHPSLKVWSLPALLYALFFIWYTDLGGPLTEPEIEQFVSDMRSMGLASERVDYYARFLREDTGREFMMVNILDKNPNPPQIPGAPPSADADALLNVYMEHMWPELLKRACHPILAGFAVHQVIDLHGIDNAEQWSDGAVMRYRSRRAFMEIISNPVTLDRHEFKLAALEKTIAYPIETSLYLGDPRFLVGLILLSLTLLTEKLMRGKTGAPHNPTSNS